MVGLRKRTIDDVYTTQINASDVSELRDRDLVLRILDMMDESSHEDLFEYLASNKTYAYPILFACMHKKKTDSLNYLLERSDELGVDVNTTLNDIQDDHTLMAMYLCLINCKR